MQFITKIAALAAMAAAMVSATNTITFVNQDETTRTIIFTPSIGHEAVSSVTIAGDATKVVTIPNAWIGNWYSVSEGAANVPGMLGEVTFQGWDGITYFDVSAIVNPNDINGVKEMFVASEMKSTVKTLISGCAVFPCNTAYYAPNDIQTATTTETDLVCTLGGSSTATKRGETKLVARNFVLGKF
jgi:hypothetical protein